MIKVLRAYKDLIKIIYEKSPIMVIMTFIIGILLGILVPLSIFINQRIFDYGLLVASGQMTFSSYMPYVIGLAIVIIIPSATYEFIIFGLITSRTVMILNTSYKGKMLRKLKTIKYEHMENSESIEIIDKTFNRAVNSARHLFPMYTINVIKALIGSLGTLYIIIKIKWWLSLTILIPFFLETKFRSKNNYNIYDEMEKYWLKERSYKTLANFFKSRDYLYEGKLNNSSEFLITTYESRLNARNKEYESFYFKHLKTYFLTGNISKLSSICNAIIMLILYINGEMSIGSLISLTLIIFTSFYRELEGISGFFTWSAFHIKFLEFYDKFFELSDDIKKDNHEKPTSYDIEFKDVSFSYPGSNKFVLKDISFKMKTGEHLSIVGENGEGKSTIIKLLLGLFEPSSGEILIGGEPLLNYSSAIRSKIFAPVFQDFTKYNMTLQENIAVGNIDLLNDEEKLYKAAVEGQAHKIGSLDILLGREFDDGIDISGGQWQRISLSRAFLGDKPILLLDEPTSQLDPMAESKLYNEFSRLNKDKSALFITHRLASTMITDRILVLSNGHIAEEGTHNELMNQNGIYSEMFKVQRKLYNEEVGDILC